VNKSLAALAALSVLGVLFGAATLLHAEEQAGPASNNRYEYRHLLILMDRDLSTYARSDEKILEPLQRAGEEGWELVSANEPAGGTLSHGRSSVEFFLKRVKR
jgi:hypothetical protein